MTVDLTAFGMPDCYERLTVEPSPEGNYVVACLPFFTYGIQFGDLVEVREPESVFGRVLKRSGFRTLRIAFSDQPTAGQGHEALHARFIGIRLPHEWHGARYVSVLIRCLAEQERALSCVEDAIQDGKLHWEVDPEPFAAGGA